MDMASTDDLGQATAHVRLVTDTEDAFNRQARHKSK
jgi:hypothetical protein